MPDVIVVGGGVGGLVAARRLAIGGLSVLLLEASDRLGGSVARQVVGGLDLDAGAESFATRGGTVATLASSLGLSDAIVEPSPAGAWLYTAAGEAFRLPENSLLGIPGSPLASDVIAIIGMPAASRAFLETLMPGTVASKAVTLGELVRRRMGPVVLDRLVRPIVRGVHSADPDDLPLDQVAPGLRNAMLRTGSLARGVLDQRAGAERAGSAVAGIRGGINRIVEELVADLQRFGVEVRLGARVTAVEPGRVILGEESIEGTVLVATPGVLGNAADRGRRVVLATLVVEEPRLDAAPRGTGVLVAAGAPGIRARALTHATAKWQWLAERAEGRHVLRLSYDGDDHDGDDYDGDDRDSTGRGDGDLAELARRDASALLGLDIAPASVVDFARAEWYRPKRMTHTPNGILVVGETIAGTGLAAIVGQSEAVAADLLRDGRA